MLQNNLKHPAPLKLFGSQPTDHGGLDQEEDKKNVFLIQLRVS